MRGPGIPTLEVTGLRKRFAGKVALDGLSVAVHQGEVLGLLGPTGAGKTTTLRSIAGLERPDGGTVRLLGADITRSSPMTRDIAVVFEGFNLLPTLSVYDNIAFPLRSPLYREPEADVRTRVLRVAEDLRISHLLGRNTRQISGGEGQRVAIARALVRSPKLFLLDEPLSALDLKLREELQAELRTMHRGRGQTLLYASHDFLSTASIASRLAIIDKGRIVQSGPLHDLYANPVHRRIGELIGSPSMNLFNAKMTREGVVIGGYPVPLALHALGFDKLSDGERVTVGFWPEDIGFDTSGGPGHAAATVWATDFRGKDQAIEARFGDSRIRKVVSANLRLAQGDACFFHLDPRKAFVFAHAGGERLSPCSGRPKPG